MHNFDSKKEITYLCILHMPSNYVYILCDSSALVMQMCLNCVIILSIRLVGKTVHMGKDANYTFQFLHTYF